MTVVTCTIPGRLRFLADAISSVNAQTRPADCQVIVSVPELGRLPQPVDLARRRNQAICAAWTSHVAFLDDDNLWGRDHLYFGMAVAKDSGAPLVFLPSTGDYQPHKDVNGWSAEQLVAELARHNWIDPSGVIVETEWLHRVGGFSENYVEWSRVDDALVTGGYPDSGMLTEDADLWMRLALAGATFATMDVQTWTYRAHGGPRGSSELQRIGEPKEGWSVIKTLHAPRWPRRAKR